MIGHIIRLHVFVTYEALLDYFSNVQVPRSKFEVVQSWILWLPETGWKTMVSFREVNACFVCRGHFLLFVLVFFFDVGRWELWMNFSFRISCFFYAVTLRGPWLFVTKVMKHPDPQTNGAYLKRVYPPSGNEGMSPGTWDYISSWIIFQGFLGSTKSITAKWGVFVVL